MNDIYFERILTPSDIELIKSWLEDPELLKMARMRDNPLTEDEYSEYLHTLSFMVYVDGLAVGYARIYKTSDPEVMEIGMVIANAEYREKGLGYAIGKRLLGVTKELGAKIVYWATSDYNYPSIKLAKKLGFKFDKCLPEIVVTGNEKHDALIYKLEI